MWKGFVLGIVFMVAVGLIGGFFAIKAGLVPANADATPSRLERWVAQTSLNATIDREAADLHDPLALTSENLTAGLNLYAQHCSVCHSDASGKPTYVGISLYQKAPEFGRHGVTDDPDTETYWKITHGIRLTGMPGFVNALNETQRWQIALFLKNMDQLPPSVKAGWKKLKAPVLPAAILKTLPVQMRRPGPPVAPNARTTEVPG